MIGQKVVAVLLAIPLLVMIFPSIRYWSDFRKEKKSERKGKKTLYNKFFLFLFVAGVLGMWVAWLGGILFLLIGAFDCDFGFFPFSMSGKAVVHTIGLVVFSVGAVTYNLCIIVAGKYLRPAPSGTLGDHRLIRKGPFAVIRHPLYTSYILILSGLGMLFQVWWLLLPILLMVVGVYPTAKAEEASLTEQFGEKYENYRDAIGMFVPKFF